MSPSRFVGYTACPIKLGALHRPAARVAETIYMLANQPDLLGAPGVSARLHAERCFVECSMPNENQSVFRLLAGSDGTPMREGTSE